MLFWGAPLEKKELQLSDNFSFFEFKYSNVSQSEVYFTMRAVLHEIREGQTGLLRQSELHRSVVAPNCFERFNDGVVQAALLRACRSVELDFTAHRPTSRRMAEVLEFVFSNADRPEGEATVEFLVALCTAHLRLDPEDLKGALAALKPWARKPRIQPFVRYLGRTRRALRAPGYHWR